MKILYGLMILCLLLTGCKNENKIDAKAFSSGNPIQKETQNVIQNLDKKTYAGLEHLFQDTDTIQTNGKFLLLVFGKNNCPYCDKFKQDIKKYQKIQDLISKDFSPYYINISYEKTHHFIFGDKEATVTTSQLSNNIYKIRVTPTIIFGDREGKTILEIGYIEPKKFEKIINFITSNQWLEGKDIKGRMQLLQSYLNKDNP